MKVILSMLKKKLYFPVALYFRFFALIRLNRWNPRVIVVTGSNGKTTLLHLLESQMGDKAKYSHHANSSYGIPFDLLDLHRISLLKSEWVKLFLLAPIHAFGKIPEEKIYIVEADCDRPGEGKFLSEFLNPEAVLWVSLSKTHSMNFEPLTGNGKFKTVEDAIAYEFGYFLEYCTKLAVLNGDSEYILDQTKRTKAKVELIEKKKLLDSYKITKDHTEFVVNKHAFTFKALLPEEIFYAITMCQKAIDYLNIKPDLSFGRLELPPGRSSIFKGVKNTTLIDSCYNANLSSMKAVLEMYAQYPAKNKWAIIGDMLEQGKGEREEHEKLAGLLEQMELDRIIFMGPRVSKYTHPVLMQNAKRKMQNNSSKDIIIEKYTGPKELLDYLNSNIKGGETILFKGSRFMEGVIENLLADKKDKDKLARREKIWEIRRKKWGL